MTHHPLTKDSVTTIVNGSAFKGDASLILKQSDEKKMQYEYEFEESLKLPIGIHPLHLECDNKSSQTINIVVE